MEYGKRGIAPTSYCLLPTAYLVCHADLMRRASLMPPGRTGLMSRAFMWRLKLLSKGRLTGALSGSVVIAHL